MQKEIQEMKIKIRQEKNKMIKMQEEERIENEAT